MRVSPLLTGLKICSLTIQVCCAAPRRPDTDGEFNRADVPFLLRPAGRASMHHETTPAPYLAASLTTVLRFRIVVGPSVRSSAPPDSFESMSFPRTSQ